MGGLSTVAVQGISALAYGVASILIMTANKSVLTNYKLACSRNMFCTRFSTIFHVFPKSIDPLMCF